MSQKLIYLRQPFHSKQNNTETHTLPSQTIHNIEQVFVPGPLKGVWNIIKAKRFFDIALIKLGLSMLVKLTTFNNHETLRQKCQLLQDRGS